MVEHRAYCVAGMTLARKRFSDPIANGAILRDAAADIGDIDTAHQGIVTSSKDKEGSGET